MNTSLFYYFIIFLILSILIYFTKLKEQFNNNDNKYQKQILKTKIVNRPIMNFYGDLKGDYDQILYKKAQEFGPGFNKQKILCNHKLRKEIQNESIDYSFAKLNEQNNKYKNCINAANYLCEFTKPEMYLSDNKYFQARWTFKPYKDKSVPKATDLNCWNQIYTCCKNKIKL